MIPAKFDYKRVSSVQEAIELLDEHGFDAKILSGGHSLIPAMKLRLNRPELLIDINGIEGMDAITEEGNELVIGAGCTHSQILHSDLIKEKVNILSQCADTIGDVQVRNRGTIGGSLAHADPSADYPAVMLACEAVIVAEGKKGERKIAAEDFFEGFFTTALKDDEIITSIRIPKTENGKYLKFYQSASRFAIVGVAIVRNGENKVKIGITGASDKPYRATGVEKAYNGNLDAAEHAVDNVSIMSDHFADEEYRSHLTKAMVKKALEA